MIDNQVGPLLSALAGFAASTAVSTSIDQWLTTTLGRTADDVDKTLTKALLPADLAAAFLKLDDLEEYSHAVESAFVTLGSPFAATPTSCSIVSSAQPAQSITTAAGCSENFYVGSTSGGIGPMVPVSWAPDLSVTATYSSNLSISIGRSSSNQGSYGAPSNVYGIAAVGTTGYSVANKFTAHDERGWPRLLRLWRKRGSRPGPHPALLDIRLRPSLDPRRR